MQIKALIGMTGSGSKVYIVQTDNLPNMNVQTHFTIYYGGTIESLDRLLGPVVQN